MEKPWRENQFSSCLWILLMQQKEYRDPLQMDQSNQLAEWNPNVSLPKQLYGPSSIPWTKMTQKYPCMNLCANRMTACMSLCVTLYGGSQIWRLWPLQNALEASRSLAWSLLSPSCKSPPTNPGTISFCHLKITLSQVNNVPNHQVDLLYLNEQAKTLSPKRSRV
jgi:hypothetical protein